jgi:hypothetical protein
VSFSDSDWDKSVPPPRGGASRMGVTVALLLAAVAGIAIGAIGASWWWASRSTAPVAPPAATGSAPALATPAEIVASAPPSSSPPVVAAAASAAAASAPVRPAVRALPPDAASAARQRELAWSQWYQRPRECAEDRRGERLVECANHYIRARREFEAAHPPR